MNADARQIRSVFLQAVEEHSPDDWPAYLDEACDGDFDLRERVEVLLQAHVQSNSLLDTSAAAPAVTIDELPGDGPGSVIGAYKLLKLIGEGGMGLVFVAEQERPVRRKVALKLIKPGMDTRQVIARFEAERQALALMDHPCIARVFDAGATEAGRPFFVMELVHGMPITDYCHQKRLATRERLELFLMVCQAVQHAHQKGVIHRDIKPSNVLVTLDDGLPTVKVIDFGVAKAISQQLTENSFHTAFSQLVGTPLYMSPEQAGMSGLDIDTRSDIYSLGVLLYELLTGTTPFESARLSKAGFNELRRIICEEEPPKPSARMSIADKMSTVDKAATTASARPQGDPRKLSKLFRGELDWIVMKALEKDRNRRYETANGLLADVRRYLNDEPVRACPPSTWYRFHKFARRNKGALLTASLVSATLITAVALLSVSYLRLQTEQQRTTGEYNRAEAEKGIANEQRGEAESRLRLVLQALDEVFVKEAERLVTLRQRAIESQAPADPQREQAEHDFLEKGLHFYEQLAQRPGTSAEAQHEMARAMSSIGHIRLGLGHSLESERAWRQAARLFEKLSKQFPDVTQYAVQQADACEWLYVPLTNIGRNEEAERVTREALAIFEQTALTLPADLRARKGLAVGHDRLARFHAQAGRLADAMPDFQLAEKFYARLAEEFPREADYREAAADLQMALAHYTGQAQQAAKLFADAAVAYEKLTAETAEGGATTRKGVAPTAQVNAWFRHELGYACVRQGNVLQQLGQLLDAEAAIRHGLEVHEKLAADFATRLDYKSRLAWSHLSLGELLNARGDRSAAEQAYRDSVALLEQIGEKDAGLGNAYEALGRFCKEDGRISESLEAWRKSLAVWEPLAAQTNELDHRWHLATNYSWVGMLQLELKDAEGAVATLLKARDAWEALPRDYPNSADYRIHLSFMYTRLSTALGAAGRQEEVLQVLAKLADLAEKAAHDSPKQWAGVRETHAGLADTFLAAGQIQEAVKAYGLAIEQRPNEAGVWGRRGAFYARLGLWDLAARDIAHDYELEPAANAHLWLRHALLSLQAGDSASYRQICRRLPELFSPAADGPDLENELVRACTIAPAAETDLGWAVHMGEKGVERHPQGPWEHFALGLARYRAGDDDGALAALENSSDWLSGRLSNPVLAMVFHRLGREQEARDALDCATREMDPVAEGFLRNPPGFMPILWWDWLCCLMLYREARTVIQGSAPPDDARLVVAQARAWAALGETKQADAACRRALALSGQNADVCVACAGIHAALGDLAATAADWREVIRIQPKNAWALHNLGSVLMASAGPDKATAEYREAIGAYSKCIELAPENAEAHNNLALLLATCSDQELRDSPRAVELAKRAVDLAPAATGYWSTLGVAQYRAGDWNAALAALTKSTETPARGDGCDGFFLAMAHWQLMHKEESRKWYGQAVEWMDQNQPNNEDLRRFRAEVAALLGESEVSTPDKP